MRKWQDRAAIDDAGSWDDVQDLWPTERGTYQSIVALSASTVVAGVGTVLYAWCAAPATSSYGNVEYVIDSTHIWQYNQSAKTCTDRTGGVTIGSAPRMAQFGDATIAVMGSATATVKSATPGTNFSALAGAPKAALICVQSGAVLMFNTDAGPNAWAASDVGDYTNWTTGESASGALYQTPGPITAAIPFGSDVLVFKSTSTYRMRYVGGVVKWSVELLFNGIGCVGEYAGAGRNGIIFCGATISDNGSNNTTWYFFDGVSFPRRINRYTTISSPGIVIYNPAADMFAIQQSGSANLFYYSATADAWGYGATPYVGASFPVAVRGDVSGRDLICSTPVSWKGTSRYDTIATSGPTSLSLTTKYFGRPDRKSLFKRITPKFWYYSVSTWTATGGFFNDAVNGGGSILTALTENPSKPTRFDISGSGAVNNYAKFKIAASGAFANLEIEDVVVDATLMGTD